MKIDFRAFQRFNAIRQQRLRLFDRVEETLKAVTHRGLPVIGYTESMQVNGFYRLKMLGVNRYFKHVYTFRGKYESGYPDDVKVMTVASRKPNQDVLLSICEREGCAPCDTLYVGDSLAKDIYG